ncbi:MAG: energy transducer TonB [Ignavibacteriales bacterium]|nr:energy transducer TonB [Ignavibacteriales bacterium]
MRRPEGLPPHFERDRTVDLGTSPTIVFEMSLAVSLVVCIAVFRLFPDVSRTAMSTQAPKEFVEFEDIQSTRQENRPPPPPRPPIPIEAPADEIVEDVDLASTEIDVRADVAPPPAADYDPSEEYFVAVEEMPEPIGGLAAIQRNVVYPEIARRAGVQGRVYVLAFVNEQGDATRVEILRGIGAGCDEAAAKAVRNAKFIPGKQRGKPVKVRVSIPIRFELVLH